MENDVLYNIVLNTKIQKLCEYLNVSKSTINRWISLKNIPKQYTFDLMKLGNIEIDYSKFKFKDKDQFFTPESTAQYCYSKLLEIIKLYKDKEEQYTYIEPAAGNGNFLKFLPNNRRIGLDIESKNKEVIIKDYLTWEPDYSKKYITIGNPPFGLRGHIALKFLNHSSKFSEYVCFILPQMFISDGKGNPRSRVVNLNLIYSEKIPEDFFLPDNTSIKVNCIFQIWSKFHKNVLYDSIDLDSDLIKIYSLSNGGTPCSNRNINMINKCDIYIPSTCFGKEKMKCYLQFKNLPNKRGYGVIFTKNKQKYIDDFTSFTDWSSIAFLSTNGAYNIRKSQILNYFNTLSTNSLKSFEV